ncbi:MAG TPA: extracellular solute-binding protein [Chloroflexi bacterium]|nr:extracellular solute-binding protein [Chloroflexota bacterium]
MKSKINAIVMAVLIMGLVLAACAPGATPTPAPEEGAPAQKSERVLRMLTWEGYAPEELVNKFTDATGIKVEVTYIGDNNELIAKMAATNGVGYDLVSPTLNYVSTAQDEFGIYQPIDISKVKTDQFTKAYLDSILEQSKFEGKSYALPFVWGTTAMVVNVEKAPDAGQSYLDLCDPQYEGRVSYRAKYDTLYMFAYALGLDPAEAVKDEESYRQVMNQVRDKLIECKPIVRTYWDSRQQLEELLTSEEVWVATSWDAIAWTLAKDDARFKYVVPKEGAVGWFDTFAISAGAEDVDAAYEWINFVMDPHNAAVIVNNTGYQTASEGSAELASPEIAKLVAESLPPEKMETIKWYFPLPSYATDIQADVEEQIKAAQSK